MKTVVWLTDIHLNFLEDNGLRQFVETIQKSGADSVWISGDISEGDSLVGLLGKLAESLRCPIYFVLGNHDYYKSSIQHVRAEVREVCAVSSYLAWLSESECVEITPEVGLLGHDSWADGRFGDYAGSDLILSDHFAIEDFNPFFSRDGVEPYSTEDESRQMLHWISSSTAKQHRLARMQELADEAERYVRENLPPALDRYSQVYFLTHVPPFREACFHTGQISDDHGLPHFACKAVGDTLVTIMKQYPHRRFVVLCGHTHSPAEARILDNLTVHAGQAVYGQPQIQRIFELEQ